MHRRDFLGLGAVAGAGVVGVLPAGAEEASAVRECYELRQYHVAAPEQKATLAAFLRDVAIPAVNRLGIRPAGVFQDEKELSPVYVLLPHATAESVLTLRARLLADPEYLDQGTAFLDAPADAPPYARVESSLLLAFTGMPRLETPASGPNRILQLRIYESPSVKTNQKKIEMFNRKEIEIFRKTGLNPVFFGEAVIGSKMPNLTYMLGFESVEEKDAAWDRFRADPQWLALRAIPEYDDKRILCGITNLILRPLPGSQI
ncbi:MAG: NIPSNAP family protein [Candidatus Hydrogenedentes bacterium]|nr:NIPSNAP family protein [Candidatus Hydrogenedentota bacterium]